MLAAATHHTHTRERAAPRWRVLAKALVPNVYLATGEQKPSTYIFVSYLTRACREAHKTHDAQSLCKIHAFAYWAFDHPSKDLWNPAGVSFLEHLCIETDKQGDIVKIFSWLRRDMQKVAIKLMRHLGHSELLIENMVDASGAIGESHVADVNRVLSAYLSANSVQ